MKAIIMAGGEGSRLRPLTCDCPKPMVPLMDRPVMSYALELLKRHGVRETAVTLRYLPDAVRDYFGDGSDFGMSMKYYAERGPLGTAGGVKQAEDFLDDTFIVLSGDGVTDCDLTEALAFHKSKGALATMVVKRVEQPGEYGVVIADEDGRVLRFSEKPGRGEALSDTVNTGIYILEPEALESIPENCACDFGQELFPRMVEEGLPVYAWEMSGYWCDIGDLHSYLQAHIDAMEGRIRLPMPGRPGGVCRMPGARVARDAVLEGPCFIGEGAVVKAGAKIGPYSVLGEGCVVGAQAGVKRTVMWKHASLGEGAQARGCVLAENAAMGAGSAAFEESVLGSGANLGDGAALPPGVKIWPGKQIPDGVRPEANVVWGGGVRQRFRLGTLPLTNPSQAARTARAYASAVKPGNVLLGRSASSVALSCSMAAEAGLMAQGVQVMDAGVSTVPQLRVMAHALRADGAVFVNEEGMRPLTGGGAELKGAVQRKIEQLLMRQDYERAFSAVTKLPVPAGRSDLMYVGHILNRADVDTLMAVHPQIAVCAPNEQLLSAAECALEKAGCCVRAEWEEEMMELAPGEIGLWLTAGGEQMRLAGEDGCLSESDGMLLRVWAMLEEGAERIVLPVSATHAAEELAGRYGAEIVRVKGERSHFMQALIEEDRHQLMMQFDGLYAAVQCIGALLRKGHTPDSWMRETPRMNRRTRAVSVSPEEKGRILGALIREEEAPDMTDGLCVSRNGAWAWISPADSANECRIVTEAASAEAAQELCDFYEGRIRKLTGETGK
ncbi:MAG: NTP transferase domain-containing protein [Clostridia bacterium]|nr:NTP transferase domain-containing protein [Clostridia bacterium]